MNKTKIKTAVFVTTAFLVGTVILGCGKADGKQSENSNKPSDISIDSANAKIEYYKDTVSALESEILELKQDSYVRECEYKLQIEKLEDEIKKLNASISADSGTKDKIPSSPSNPDNSFDLITDKKEIDEKVFTYKIENGKATITGYTGEKKEITIPSQINGLEVQKIGDSAFASSSLEKITISNGIREIDWFAFSGCFALKSISVPASVTSVGYGAFENCPKNMTVECQKGSYIESYAASWGMNFAAE